jgi:hypothetical protein
MKKLNLFSVYDLIYVLDLMAGQPDLSLSFLDRSFHLPAVNDAKSQHKRRGLHSQRKGHIPLITIQSYRQLAETGRTTRDPSRLFGGSEQVSTLTLRHFLGV